MNQDILNLIKNGSSNLKPNSKIFFYGYTMFKSHTFIVQDEKVVMCIPKNHDLVDIAQSFIQLGYTLAPVGETFIVLEEHNIAFVGNKTRIVPIHTSQPEYT